MPVKCVRCRGEGEVAIALRVEYQRLQAAEAALRGMHHQLPKFFGFIMTRSLSNVDDRISELRKDFAAFNDRAWREFEDRERRERW